jgi:signal transduction histidine kinase
MANSDGLGQHMSEEQMRGVERGGVAVLAALTVIQIAIITALSSYPALAAHLRLQPQPGIWPYLAAVACFLPLMVRRRHPGVALVGTSTLAGLYLAMPWPPAIVVLAPMIALFTVAERYGGHRVIPIGIVLGAILMGVSAMTVSVSYTVAQVVAILALLGLAAALGHGARTRRELFEEVRRKRQEESKRRIDEERLRIARDVHDIMAHSLTLMTLQADAGLTAVADQARATAAFTVIGDTGRATLRDLRSMLAVLAGDEGENSPRQPVADLGRLAELMHSVRETGLDVALSTTGDLQAVPSAVSVSAYRIVQEALTNVVRHSGAKHANVTVAADQNELTLQVVDDGSAGASAPETSGGRGLLGMRERVEALGGRITTAPEPGGGFAVRASIPTTKGRSGSASNDGRAADAEPDRHEPRSA